MQTSLAISAGLAQKPGHTHLSRNPSMQSKHTRERSASTQTSRKSPDSMKLALNTNVPSSSPAKPNIRKSILRVDAFLGEWLTPDYYDQITPPPGSTMMVAGAKADLLRREDYSSLIVNPEVVAKKHNLGFPGGWQSPTVVAGKVDDGLTDLSSLNQALPKRDRGSSVSAVNGRSSGRHTHEVPQEAEYGLYQPPVPNYAISSSEPIPSGYVAHARDACVDVDYQWDSMREPQLWSNGGEYGEEWSSMHKRFRSGLQDMIQWYTNNDDTGKLVSRNTPKTPGYVSPQDEETDLVLIVVSHGAGCNALIGALTNQPVLLDVGMASLTMAIRKPDPPPSPVSTPSIPQSPQSSISAQYDMALLASTEHLRSSTTSTPASSRTPSVSSMSAFRERSYAIEPIRGISGNATSPPSLTNLQYSMNGSFGGIRRKTSSASTGPRTYNSSSVRQTSIGLWSATTRAEKDGEQEDEESDADSIMLNFGSDTARDAKPLDQTLDTQQKVEEAEIEVVKEMDKEEKGETCDDEDDDLAPLGGGLWGKPGTPGYGVRDGVKRRWTVIERAAN